MQHNTGSLAPSRQRSPGNYKRSDERAHPIDPPLAGPLSVCSDSFHPSDGLLSANGCYFRLASRKKTIALPDTDFGS